jgi:hypothetical protein
MEIFRAFAIGVVTGVIYAWPFAASGSYKRLLMSGIREGRGAALLKKTVSLVVGVLVALGGFILVGGLSTQAFAWIDLILFLSAAAASGWLAWRYIYSGPRA